MNLSPLHHGQEHPWHFPATETMLFRLGLAGAGALLLHVAFLVATSAPLSKSPSDVTLLIASGLVGLGLLLAAGLRRPPPALRWLILLACLSELLIRASIWVQTSRLPDLVVADPGLYTDFAGELMRQGENPYAWDLGGAFDLYRTPRAASTPRLDAASERDFPYPALAFLAVIPFQALGLPGTFSLAVLTHAAVLVALFLASPRPFQPLILIPVLVRIDFTPLTLIGAVDILWIALLVGVIIAWRRPVWRAVLYGCAAALKQGPWLVAPFLLIRLWRDEGEESPLRRVASFLTVSGLTFLIINGPFIVWNPAAWLRGATEPLHDSLVVLSQGGLSTLTQMGFVYLPKGYYLVATLAVLGLLLFCYWRHYDTLRDTFWLMPGIFLWFSYRTLISYWIYWLFPGLAALATRTPPARASAPQPSWRLTLAIATGTLGALVGAGILLASSSAPVAVRPIYPLLATGGRVNQISLEVRNNGQRPLTPRFAVQNLASVTNPLPWQIDRGPLSLPPGQSATYQISVNDDRAFFFHDMAQVVVTDAGGDYELRGVATLEPDRSFLWPDAIPNPAYRYWDRDQDVPFFWGLTDKPSGAGSVSLAHEEDREVLWLNLDATGEGMNRVALQSWILLPSKPFGIWVYPDSPSEDSSASAYGLEIDDGHHRLWFLFGSRTYAGLADDDVYVIHRLAPPRTWSYQTIDVPAAYAQVGWPLPELQPADYRGIDADQRVVFIRLFLAAAGPQGKVRARFGPIEQDYHLDPPSLMAETFADPAAYYVRLASTYLRGRNYRQASEAYQQALQFSPGDPAALKGLLLAEQRLAGDDPR